MTSPTQRLNILTAFRKDSGLDMGAALEVLGKRYTRIEGWWCVECELALPASDVASHEAEIHGRSLLEGAG